MSCKHDQTTLNCPRCDRPCKFTPTPEGSASIPITPKPKVEYLSRKDFKFSDCPHSNDLTRVCQKCKNLFRNPEK